MNKITCTTILLFSCIACAPAPERSVIILDGCVDAVPTLHLELRSDTSATYRLSAIGHFGSDAMRPEHKDAGEVSIKRRPQTRDAYAVSVETQQDDGTWEETDYRDLVQCE